MAETSDADVCIHQSQEVFLTPSKDKQSKCTRIKSKSIIKLPPVQVVFGFTVNEFNRKVYKHSYSMWAHLLTNCKFSLGLSIHSSVSAVTQSERRHSGGGAPCSLLWQPTEIDTVWWTPPVAGNSSAPPSGSRESHRAEAGHTFALPLCNNSNNYKH